MVTSKKKKDKKVELNIAIYFYKHFKLIIKFSNSWYTIHKKDHYISNLPKSLPIYEHWAIPIQILFHIIYLGFKFKIMFNNAIYVLNIVLFKTTNQKYIIPL